MFICVCVTQLHILFLQIFCVYVYICLCQGSSIGIYMLLEAKHDVFLNLNILSSVSYWTWEFAVAARLDGQQALEMHCSLSQLLH